MLCLVMVTGLNGVQFITSDKQNWMSRKLFSQVMIIDRIGRHEVLLQNQFTIKSSISEKAMFMLN